MVFSPAMTQLRALVLIILSFASQAFGSADCGQGSAGRNSYDYCIYNSEGSTSRDVLYYLHGNGGHAGIWGEREDFRKIEQIWKALGKQAPTVIGISFGKTWFMTEDGGWWAKSYLESFRDEAMPQMEARLGRPVASRIVFGESMGGFNTTQLYLKASGLFVRAAIVCPALPGISPQAGYDEVEDYIERHQPYVNRKLVEKWQGKMADAFPSAEVWSRHDPLVLARGKGPDTIPLYLMSEVQDPFAFYEGASAFREVLRERQAPHYWERIPTATHCTQTPESLDRLARFLVGGA